MVGVSGGIDSAVTSALCARTNLPVLCVEMPIHQAASQVQRAQEHITALRKTHANVRMEVAQLTPVFDQMVTVLPKHENMALMELALANTRARLRMTALYYLSLIHI